MSDSATLDWLPAAAMTLTGAGLFGASLVIAGVPSTSASTLGPRGVTRTRARESALFATTEPLLRLVAGWVARLPSSGWRERLESTLLQSGYWLGITADELVAMSALLGLLLGGIGVWLSARFGWSPTMPLLFAAVGAAHPFSQVRDATTTRQREIERRLPDAVDLLSLCMGAGLDFPASMRRLLVDGIPPESPTGTELGRIRDELELGHTRKQALEAFAARVPSRPVRDFVGAVVQAEEKGTPLAEILRVQGRMLRMRRSVLAEEAAARAAMQLNLPLLMIFAAIMLLVLGPVGITVMEINNV